MKRTSINVTLSLLGALALGTLSAQKNEVTEPVQGSVEQMQSSPVGSITAQPHGGFSTNIDGKWDCKAFGAMILKQSGESVTGTYGKNGKIKGMLKEHRFIGTWSEAAGARKGSFDLTTSIERMTTRPTNLRGKWKNARDRNWQSKPWECSN
jgi:hypothetical protein